MTPLDRFVLYGLVPLQIASLWLFLLLLVTKG